MDEQALIRAVADAIYREGKARRDFEGAETELYAAKRELTDAWTALRNYQDEQVKAVLDASDQPA